MSDFEDMTKDELAEIAASMDIEGRSSMTKDELTAAIKKQAKKGVESRKVTPVIPDPPEDPRPVQPEGNPDEASTRNTADGGSLGGTITGPDTSTAPAPTPPPLRQ